MLLAAVVFSACEGDVIGLDLQNQIIDGVEYSVQEFRIAESFPVQIGLTVEIENRSDAPQSLIFPDGCVVLMRAYVEGNNEPVWDMGRDVACTQAVVQVDLDPGESEDFQVGLVSAATILGDSLPDGQYRITAHLRPGQDVELDAGMADLAIPR
jgi:hypothetical protein